MNCTYVKLGLLLLFLCNRWAQFMAILYGFAARCLFGVVSLHKAKQGRWLCVQSQYPWRGEEIGDSLGLKGFGAFMVNQCAVLWCRSKLWVKTSHSNLPSLALCRKTTTNKKRAAKPYKMAMNWAQVTQKKQQQAQVYVSTISFYIHAYISTFLTTVLNFLYKVFKSFVTYKTVSKLSVIYAPSLGHLCPCQNNFVT